MLNGSKKILDPFGGTGKVFLLNHWYPQVEIQAIELEPEWAAHNPKTIKGLHFTCSHFMSLRWSEPQAYVITGREIEIKISDPHEKKLYKAMR